MKSKRTLTRKLDIIISQIVRSRGYCVRCARRNHLQAAHIFSRSIMSTRFALNNILCLCPDCHINFAHKKPILFAEWVQCWLGEKEYDKLKKQAVSIRKWTVEDLEALYEDYKEILAKNT